MDDITGDGLFSRIFIRWHFENDQGFSQISETKVKEAL